MNRLDRFIPFLLDRVEVARSKGYQQFTLTHPAGDTMLVTLDGERIEVVRMVGRMGGADVEGFPFRLVTTEDDLRRDLREGLTSTLSEGLRG